MILSHSPCEATILTFDLSKGCRVDRISKRTHNPHVKIAVTFVARFVDDVKISVDEPRIAQRWRTSNKLSKERIAFLAAVVCWATGHG